MNVSLELNNLICQIDSHSSGQIVGFCIDENCKENNKFACLDCIFEVHPQHKLVKLKELNNFISEKLKDYKKYLEEEKLLTEIYNKNLEKNTKKMNDFKKNVIKILEVKIINFLDELRKKYSELNKSKNEQDFSNLIEYQNFFDSNAAPTMKPDLLKLSQICTNLHKEALQKTKKGEEEMKKQKQKQNETDMGDNDAPAEIPKNFMKYNVMLDKLNIEFDKFLSEQLKTISIYINENFLKLPEDFLVDSSLNFEWCNKSYANYDFFYELTNDNKKATKILSKGIMTILRAKEKLQENFKYNIKFKIGMSKNEIDFDLGIGTEKCGDTCWLRNRNSLCISSMGIRNMDLIMDDTVKLKDNDIVDIEISTKKDNNYFKAILNNKLVCLLDFHFDEDVFIMAAMRNTGDYIEVLEYNVTPEF